jgi:hypothetical protein
MDRLLLMLWVALLGIDRVDLLGGNGPLVLVPFQTVTVLTVLVEWGRRLQAGHLPVPTASARRFTALVLTLLAIITLSILRSADVTTSLGRALLLAATAVGVSLTIWGAADREDLGNLLARGAQLGLVVALGFNVVCLLALVGVIPELQRFGPIAVDITPSVYGTLPRLSGGALDMNRGGLMALIHTVLIALAPGKIRLRSAWIAFGAILVLGSLSRSVMLAAIPSVLYAALMARGRLPNPRVIGVACAGIALGAMALLNPTLRERTARVTAPLANRVSLREGSAQSHLELFARGGEVATRSTAGTLLGIGFGTSFRELADYFAGNRYGNFHSTWLTLWVESGIISAFVALVLIAGALHQGGPLRGLIVGLVFYNTFYNGLGEPLLWVTLALAWIAPQVLAKPSRSLVTAEAA